MTFKKNLFVEFSIVKSATWKDCLMALELRHLKQKLKLIPLDDIIWYTQFSSTLFLWFYRFVNECELLSIITKLILKVKIIQLNSTQRNKNCSLYWHYLSNEWNNRSFFIFAIYAIALRNVRKLICCFTVCWIFKGNFSHIHNNKHLAFRHLFISLAPSACT